MISAVAVNELVIRTLQSVQRIEASNRAYLAAEAGIEDALYELSPHFAGYETPPLDDLDENIRQANFSATGPRWDNRWTIESHNKNLDPTTWDGTFYVSQKLMIYLFNDINYATAVGTNVLNEGLADIETLNVAGNFSITFTIPEPTDFIVNQLQIDNDEDGQLNEDPEGASNAVCAFNQPVEDEDCDGLVNEDGDEDPIVLWKLTDGASRSLIPYKGCLSEIDAEHSEICEKDFNAGSNYSVTLDQSATGKNENELPETIGNFIADVFGANPNAKLHFEFLIIAPMDHFDDTTNKRIKIPYLEYEVSSSSDEIPYPYFTIKSDGYYGSYKQSITSIVTPKTTVPLFDFTIIQQQ